MAEQKNANRGRPAKAARLKSRAGRFYIIDGTTRKSTGTGNRREAEAELARHINQIVDAFTAPVEAAGRPNLGPRLFKRGNRYWIRDGEHRETTGTDDPVKAQSALSRYIETRDRRDGPLPPDKMKVADALEKYRVERSPYIAAPAQIGYNIKALLPILGEYIVGDITANICRTYGEKRGKTAGTIHRELSVLQAAINHCVREGYLTAGRKITLPSKPQGGTRWLTRKEVADLVRTAYRNPRTKHLARFILIAVYTGTRSGAVLGLKFEKHEQGGRVDFENGLIYRATEGEIETNKRKPTIPIPPRLRAHLERWQRMGAEWAVEYRGPGKGNSRGGQVKSIKKVWRAVLKDSSVAPARPHDLRHTCATWLLRAGVNEWDIAGFLGMSRDTLHKVYGHHHPDHMKGAVEAINRMGK